jgi:hypothetical protein
MGPILILDKSALQRLSRTEVWRLRKHFSLNIPPILIAEILGDLAKAKPEDRDQVIYLARKLPAIDQYENEHYVKLCLGSLTGMHFEMRGVPILSGGIPVQTKSGERGIFFDSTPEQLALLRWSQGDFTVGDHQQAQLWRGMIPDIDLESYRDRLSRHYLILPKAGSFPELAQSVDSLIRNSAVHEALLKFLLEEFFAPEELRDLILLLWRMKGKPDLHTYAPYAAHCLRVLLIFVGGLRNKLISNRLTNRLDLEYCYYLPFCMAFVSADLLHKDLASVLLRTEQDFIDADQLKNELRQLEEEWEQLSPADQAERNSEYGDYPPERAGTIATTLWKKHMRPWRPGSGNRALKMTEEQKARLMAKLQEFDEAVSSVKDPRKHP